MKKVYCENCNRCRDCRFGKQIDIIFGMPVFTCVVKRLKKDLQKLQGTVGDSTKHPHFLHEKADEILIEFVVNLTQDDEIRKIWDGIPRWYS